VHEHAVLSESPWVVFPGNLQGRHIRETGPRGAVLVTADETGIQAVQRLIVDVMRWERLDVDVSAATDLNSAVLLAGRALQAMLAPQAASSDGKPISVRVTLSGRTAAHGELFGLHTQLREELLAQAAAMAGDRLWIEKLRLETTPLAGASQLSERADAIADLQELLAQAPLDEAFMRSLTDDLQLLTARAPLELSEALPEFKAIRAGDVSAIVAAVTPSLLAQLATPR
jgi:DNA repair exonuclease SbcCD nuclease subunit